MLIIDADTTIEQIYAPVTAAKRALAEFAEAAVSDDLTCGGRIVGMAQNVKTAEDLASAQSTYLNVLKNHPANRTYYLMDIVTRRDDTYSGRGNDSTRSSMDAIIGWARSEVDRIRREG